MVESFLFLGYVTFSALTVYCRVEYSLDNIRWRTTQNVFVYRSVLTETEKFNCVLERIEPPFARMINAIYGCHFLLLYIADVVWVSLFFAVFILSRNKYLSLLTRIDSGAHTQVLGRLWMQVEKKV